MFNLPRLAKQTTSTGAVQDVTLEPGMQSALRDGVNRLPAPVPAKDFNHTVLRELTSGRDFSPWWTQMLTRLRWMALPAVLSMALTLALISVASITISPIPIRATPPRVAPIPAPALPSLPSRLIPAHHDHTDGAAMIPIHE